MQLDEQSRQSKVGSLLHRGISRFMDAQYADALECFNEAANLEPGNAEAHAWLAAVYGRQIEEVWSLTDKIKLLSRLEEEVETALAIDPALPIARRMNGAKLLNTPDMLGGDHSAAAEEFLYCIGRGMDDAELWLSLAICYVEMEMPAKAIHALKEALAREPGNAKAAELLRQVQDGSFEK